MKKILCAVLCVITVLCFAGCEGYSTPSDAVNAYYKAYSEGDYKAVLDCYPKASRDYFITAAGGEEAFEASVKNITELGTVNYRIVSEEPVTDASSIDSSLEHIGNLFEYTEACYVNLKIYISLSDGSTYPQDTENLETTRIVTVKVDNKWYIFDDVDYTDGDDADSVDEEA